MDFSIASVLTLDGLTNGAIYALLGVGIVLVFTVTRVIFIEQGEFVAWGALTLAMFQMRQVPGTVWLLLILGVVAAAMELVAVWRHRRRARPACGAALRTLAPAVLIGALSIWAAPRGWPLLVQAALSAAIVTAFGPLVYRVAYQSLAGRSTLVLLIVSIGVHLAMTGLGLLMFGAEGFNNPPFIDAQLSIGSFTVSAQALIIFGTSAVLIALMRLFFARTLYGKALLATAVNRLGARLMGISTETAGRLSFTMAAFIGALSGLLIGPTATVVYDWGLLVGLKGFVAAVIAGLASYPGALAGALAVGLVESFGAFWASPYKNVIVFTLIVPVLLWRSLTSGHHDEEQE
jgi:branched-chain amino acid transport system permease protein